MPTAAAKKPPARKRGVVEVPKKKARRKPANGAAGASGFYDQAVAAYLNYRSRVERDLPGDHIGDWLAAEKTPDV